MKQLIASTGLLALLSSCDTAAEAQPDAKDTVTQEEEQLDNRKLAFINGALISVYDFATGDTKELVKGTDPCISPDGEWVAFTQQQTVVDPRTIKLVHTGDLSIKDLKINNENYYGAVWSPTGDYLAFSVLDEDGWQVGLIKPDGSDFKTLKVDNGNFGLFSPTWSHSGEYVFAHDISFLYKFDINGALKEKLDLSSQLSKSKGIYISSSTRFWFTSDGKKIIYTGEVDEPVEGMYDLPCAVFSYDVDTKEINRITGKGVYVVEELWLDKQDNIYFPRFKNVGDPERIFQMSLTDTTLVELMEGGSPSSSH